MSKRIVLAVLVGVIATSMSAGTSVAGERDFIVARVLFRYWGQ